MGKTRPRRTRRASFAPRLIVMAKTPRAGGIKQRLAASVGAVSAARFYRTCLAHTLMRLGRDPRWRTLLAVSPDRDVSAPYWPRGIERMPQGNGDLAARMQRLFRRLPPGPAIIVGSDIPAIRPSDISRAFRLIGNGDAVFGRAADGGYWLVGLRRSPRLLAPFAHVRWSGPHALADTLRNLEGHRIAFAATLSDVDSEEDYRGSRGNFERLIPAR
jgi:rSAM/selenodomain-associated transferase 1